MTAATLIRRSLWHYRRAHLGVAAGAATAAAVLIGALAVGDSVRYTLRRQGRARIGRVRLVAGTPDRFFRTALARAVSDDLSAPAAPVLLLRAAAGPETDRVGDVQLLGVTGRFWKLSPAGKPPAHLHGDEVALNRRLADRLGVHIGQTIPVRIPKPAAFSRDAPLTTTADASTGVRLTVRAIVDDDAFGRFSLQANQIVPYTLYVPLDWLARRIDRPDKANLLLIGGDATAARASVALAKHWRLDDAELILTPLGDTGWIELRTPRVFLDDETVRAAADARPGAVGVLTYLVNDLRAGDRATPYSMVAAIGALNASPDSGAQVSPVRPEGGRIVAQAVRPGFPASFSDGQAPKGRQETLGYRPSGAWRRREGGALRIPGLTAWATTLTPSGLTTASAPAPASQPASFGAWRGKEGGALLIPGLMAWAATLTPSGLTAATSPAPGPEGPASLIPPGMADDEIVVNDWLAKDLAVKPGDAVTLTYFVLGPMRKLETRAKKFRVRAVVPIEGPAADRTLMPDFPGVTDTQNCTDWDPGFDLDLKRIRTNDEDYWDRHRGTPKAFVTLAKGREMWANRFGDLTAIRWPVPPAATAALAERIRQRLGPAAAGLSVRDVRAAATAAGSPATNFGGLFLSLSVFLIASAVLLLGLLFVFGVQQRSAQVGMLSALGWRTGRIRRVLLAEGALVAVVGVAAGVPLGLAYTRGMLAALSGVWRGAVAGAAIRFHADPLTVSAAAAGSFLIAVAAMWIVLRRAARAAPHELLAGTRALDAHPPRGRRRLLQAVIFGCTVAGVVVIGLFRHATGPRAAGAFFAAGVLLLTAFLAAGRLWLTLLASAGERRVPAPGMLAMRNAARRPGRSLAVMALLACGCFLVASVSAFWINPAANARRRSSGTGGFALIGTSAIPLFADPNTPKGLSELNMPTDSRDVLTDVRFVPLRVREGDDASCLNLNRPQRPQLLGVDPAELARRKAFSFVKAADGLSVRDGWALLDARPGDDAVPGITDDEAATWALHKKVGETIDYVDERGRPFKVKLVATIANSILQGNVLIPERAFIERFGSQAGYRMFLIDAPAGSTDRVRRTLSAAGSDIGLDLTTTVRRLGDFSQVQNTYLSIFQALGGLGLILGSVGMGVVVMRNVLERRGELALMQAVGFRRNVLHRLLLTEHAALLLAGLLFGVAAAVAAVWPALRSGGSAVPYLLLSALLAGVVITGLAFTALATRAALAGPLIPALRDE